MIDISICPVLSFKKAKALVGVLMTHDKSICVQVLEEQYDMMHKAKERQVGKVQATPHVSITIMDVEHTSEVEDTPEVEHTDIPMSPTKITFEAAGGSMHQLLIFHHFDSPLPRCLTTLSIQSIMTTIPMPTHL